MKYDFVVGLDPDTEKTGVAILRVSDSSLLLEAHDLSGVIGVFEDMEQLQRLNGDLVLIRVECGFLNKSNWHLGSCHTIYAHKGLNAALSTAAKIGEKVGRNHETARVIVQLAKRMGLTVEEVKPTETKINAEAFRAITKYEGRSSQEKRDAAMLCVPFMKL